ncbi:hypothetical protein [Halarchaeum sp. P4]|uniref:hypothetical protein n=1 Tax=Halarchaeum sp. P4 TaxID=3421639 RepID=UPI003EBC094A
MTRQSQARSVALAALVALSVVAGSIAFTGTVAAAASGTIDTDPADPGANATHTVSVDVTSNEAGNSLSTVYVNYSADPAFDGDVSNVTTADVLAVGIDMDEDGDIDRNATDLKNVLHRNGTVVFDFGGDTDIDYNESVIVTYDNVTNPTTGSYNVTLDVNHQSKFDPVNATLTTGSNVTDYENETTTVTGYEPASNHNEIIDPAPPKPGATAVHHVALATSSNEVGNSLSDVQVNYHADGSYDGSVQDVGINDVKKVGFDVDGDGDIEISTMDDLKEVSTNNVGETVTFDFGGNYGIKDDYTVVVVYGDAANPNDAGNYSVEADINVQSTQNPRTGSLVLANFTFRNTSIQNYTATNTTYTNTTVLNGTWENVTVANSTWTNVTQNGTVLANTTVLNGTWTNATFTNATLTNTTWANTTLTNATLANATWANASVWNTSVVNATLTNASFEDVTVANSTWTNATWTNTSVWNTSVVNATLTNASLQNVTWANTTWTNTSLTNTSVANSTFTNATWTNTSVANASVTNSTWANASVVNSTWGNATWTNTSVTNSTLTNTSVVNTTITNATVQNVTWANSSLANTTWANTSTANATFQNVTFQNVTLTNVTFANVTWTNVTVHDVALTNVTVTNATWTNSTMTDSAFHNVSESGVDHRNVTLQELHVENESLSDATLEDHKYKHEEKYVRETLDGDQNSDR